MPILQARPYDGSPAFNQAWSHMTRSMHTEMLSRPTPRRLLPWPDPNVYQPFPKQISPATLNYNTSKRLRILSRVPRGKYTPKYKPQLPSEHHVESGNLNFVPGPRLLELAQPRVIAIPSKDRRSTKKIKRKHKNWEKEREEWLTLRAAPKPIPPQPSIPKWKRKTTPLSPEEREVRIIQLSRPTSRYMIKPDPWDPYQVNPKSQRAKASKRTLELAAHRELPEEARLDLAYKPFTIKKSALKYKRKVKKKKRFCCTKMHSKVVAGDKTVRKKLLRSASKIKIPINEQDKAKIHSEYTNRLMSQNCKTKLSSIEIKKHSTCQISDSKTTLYKNMKKLLETKYKKITSSTSSREKLSPDKSRYDPKVYNLTKVKEKTPFSGKPPKKTSSMSDSNTVDSTYNSKEEKYLSNQESLPNDTLGSEIENNSQKPDLPEPHKIEQRNTTMEKSEETPIMKKISGKKTALNGKKMAKSKDPEMNKNLMKGQEKTKKFKISKRLASLARPKELPIPVKKDLAFKPFKVPKRALLFRDSSRLIKSGTNEKNISQTVKKKGNRKSIINVFDSNRPHFGHYRKKRRLLKTSKPYFPTPRILELAKPIQKLPPVDVLSPEEIFTVKKRSLKAKCSKRISELAFPVMRPEEYRITAEYPFATKRRSLRAKCTKRVKELAKPLARRCRTPIRKESNDDGAEG